MTALGDMHTSSNAGTSAILSPAAPRPLEIMRIECKEISPTCTKEKRSQAHILDIQQASHSLDAMQLNNAAWEVVSCRILTAGLRQLPSRARDAPRCPLALSGLHVHECLPLEHIAFKRRDHLEQETTTAATSQYIFIPPKHVSVRSSQRPQRPQRPSRAGSRAAKRPLGQMLPRSIESRMARGVEAIWHFPEHLAEAHPALQQRGGGEGMGKQSLR